ncbi:MAG: AI-2E family transporter [Clostridium sp.]|nr:AI-2E family transporter [Clostridium sp.]MCM1444025.1 AI-2E family transporter [Candidatus Amulumruptor caecigallinarius]
MFKNKLNFKLINIAILVLIVFLLYQTSGLWGAILSKIITIILPFMIAFIIAYALNPCVRFLKSKGIPKWLSILLVVLLVAGILVTIVLIAFPLLFNQLSSLFTGIVSFFKELSTTFDLNFGDIQNTLSNTFTSILSNLGTYVSNGAINFIGVSLSFFSAFLVGVSATIYFLIDMDSIRKEVKLFVRKKSKKVYKYISILDEQMKQYLIGFMKILVINFFLYSFAFLIVGHPNAILLGFMASLLSLIPYFGGIFTNIIALVTAFVVSPALFIKTIVAVIILSILDGNVISPLVYGKANKVHPIVIIMSIFAGGLIFGFIGVVFALPIAIIIITTIKYFKEDISDIIDDKKKK